MWFNKRTEIMFYFNEIYELLDVFVGTISAFSFMLLEY